MAPLGAVARLSSPSASLLAPRTSSRRSSFNGRTLPRSPCQIPQQLHLRVAGARAETVTITADKVNDYLADGYKVLDIRDPTQYVRAHIKGSEHIPAFIVNNDLDPGTLVARMAHTGMNGVLYGQAFTKPNKEFLKSVEAKFAKDDKILLVCQSGYRSAMASEDLERLGYRDVAFVEKGLEDTKPGTIPTEGTMELDRVGKAVGLAYYIWPISFTLSAILGALYLAIEFFPDEVLPYVNAVLDKAKDQTAGL